MNSSWLVLFSFAHAQFGSRWIFARACRRRRGASGSARADEAGQGPLRAGTSAHRLAPGSITIESSKISRVANAPEVRTLECMWGAQGATASACAPLRGRRGVTARLRPWGAALILATAATLTFATFRAKPADFRCGDALALLSNVLGWSYFTAWTVSFYPQVLLNWERKSVKGLSFDYVVMNLIGYAAYATYTCAFFFSPSLRAKGTDLVRLNDVFFCLHALLLCSVMAIQLCIYDRGQQRVSMFVAIVASIVVAAMFTFLILVLVGACSDCTWLNFLYALSYVKLAITLLKYCPQVWLNFRRKSTEGWIIDNVILDFTGGFLSTSQLLLDAGCTRNWDSITGDAVKFGLGIISMSFDVFFLVQHFVLYRKKCPPMSESRATRAHVESNITEPLI